jgi:DNA adenine methylase
MPYLWYSQGCDRVRHLDPPAPPVTPRAVAPYNQRAGRLTLAPSSSGTRTAGPRRSRPTSLRGLALHSKEPSVKYVGSKRRIAKDILPVMLSRRLEGQTYVEPFVGGFNTLCLVEGPRLAADRHPYLIALFRAIQKGWTPPSSVSEETYRRIRDDPSHYEPHLVGFVGFGCSYSGKWWGGYARGGNPDGTHRNYADESCRHLMRQAQTLGVLDVQIVCCDYRELRIPPHSLVYCDPPYSGTTGYSVGTWNPSEFWGWARKLAEDGHDVFISEYEAPDGFQCVWQKSGQCFSLTKQTGDKRAVERLFRPVL